MAPEIVTLRDTASGSSAEILVSQGFNCFRFTAQVGGRPIEVIYAPPDFATGEGRPSRGGIPILFPFPGRIPGTTFRWEGQEYSLEAGDAHGNAIHGFVHARPWRVIEQTGNRVVGEFQAWRDDPSLEHRWPSDFRITATYSLNGNVLRSFLDIENPGDVPLPCGLGVHPYFQLPAADQGRDDCLIKLPVSARWELAHMLPTGRKLELPNAEEFHAGQRFAALQLDDVFTDLQPLADPFQTHEASIQTPSGDITRIAFSGFRECVVYTPPHREAICIEPYTCVAGAFAPHMQGLDAGVRVVPPGGSFHTIVGYSVMGG